MSSRKHGQCAKCERWIPTQKVIIQPPPPPPPPPTADGIYYAITDRLISAEENMIAFLTINFSEGPSGVYTNNSTNTNYSIVGPVTSSGRFIFKIYINNILNYSVTAENELYLGGSRTIPIGQTFSLAVAPVDDPVLVNFFIEVTPDS